MNEIKTVKTNLQLQAWTNMIQECHASGLSARQWCEERGLNPKTYYYRQRKVREAMLQTMSNEATSDIKCQNDQSPSFAKLEVQMPAIDTNTSAILIHVNGISVEVRNGASKDTIEAVLLALKSVC